MSWVVTLVGFRMVFVVSVAWGSNLIVFGFRAGVCAFGVCRMFIVLWECVVSFFLVVGVLTARC